MADDSPLTAEQLERLLADGAARTYWFETGQSRAEREATMNLVPPAAQKAALKIVKEHILEPLAEELPADRPLLFFMATEDEEVDDDEQEQRLHSSDWRLICRESPDGLLCDFNGWPGDNEDGAGVYVDFATRRMTVLFVNSDSALEGRWPEHAAVLKWYEKQRQGPEAGDTEAESRKTDRTATDDEANKS